MGEGGERCSPQWVWAHPSGEEVVTPPPRKQPLSKSLSTFGRKLLLFSRQIFHPWGLQPIRYRRGSHTKLIHRGEAVIATGCFGFGRGAQRLSE